MRLAVPMIRAMDKPLALRCLADGLINAVIICVVWFVMDAHGRRHTSDVVEYVVIAVVVTGLFEAGRYVYELRKTRRTS